MEFDHLLSVAALVEDEEGRVLMLRSPDRGWEYPGGMVEPGETLQQALHREIFEETGVSVEIISLAGVSKNMSRNIVNVDFRCRYTGGVLTTSPESLEVRWMTREEALDAVTLEVTEKRLRGMLERTENYCFAFHRRPYDLMDDEVYR